MIKLNDYLYSGDTILTVLYKYSGDLRSDAEKTGNCVDQAHAVFLGQIIHVLQHNDFLTSQSQRMREFYEYMSDRYPQLAFTFHGRIKSLIRAEERFNSYVVRSIVENYRRIGRGLTPEEWTDRLDVFHDLITYRIVIAVPQCYLKPGENQEDVQVERLYEIANALPDFLKRQGFDPVILKYDKTEADPRIRQENRMLYRDYVYCPTATGYRSLHISLWDTISRFPIEVQLRTKDMDDHAELGASSHRGAETSTIVNDEYIRMAEEQKDDMLYEALIRCRLLNDLELSGLKVNMFTAFNNQLINDGCGLYRGRQILPYEHLSRFQKDQKRWK